jgi:hypothetical protein
MTVNVALGIGSPLWIAIVAPWTAGVGLLLAASNYLAVKALWYAKTQP